MSLLEDKT